MMIRLRSARSLLPALLAGIAFTPLAGCTSDVGPAMDDPAQGGAPGGVARQEEARARLASSPAPVAGRPGTLDQRFGGVGYVHAPSGGGALELSAIRQVAGGKIVVGGSSSGKLGGGQIESLRFLEEGTPDRSFHGTGSAPYRPCQCSSFDGNIHGIHQRGDGTLLFAGWTWHREEMGSSGKRSDDILLLRYRDDGTLDSAPGDTGLDLLDLGGEEHVHAAAFPAGEGAVFVAGDRDGKLFVAKMLDRGGRLDAPRFAAPRGWVAPDVGSAASDAGAMALDGAGRLVVAGWAEANGDRDVVVVRLLANGTPDESFGAGGVVKLARAGAQRGSGVVVLPDGRIVVAGDTDEGDTRRFLLVRLLPSGALDPAFGEGGVALAPLGKSTLELSSAIAMARMQDGRIVVGGNGATAGVEGPVIARLLPDGKLDPAFGQGGEATFTVVQGPGWSPSRGGSTDKTLQALALTLDEKHLLVAGSWSAYPFKGYLARLWN